MDFFDFKILFFLVGFLWFIFIYLCFDSLRFLLNNFFFWLVGMKEDGVGMFLDKLFDFLLVMI